MGFDVGNGGNEEEWAGEGRGRSAEDATLGNAIGTGMIFKTCSAPRGWQIGLRKEGIVTHKLGETRASRSRVTGFRKSHGSPSVTDRRARRRFRKETVTKCKEDEEDAKDDVGWVS